jgi:hypothetical protein
MLPPPPAPRTPAVRPAFVLVLALVALPILVVFGVGMVTEDEIEGSKSLIMAAIYVLGAMVAPVVLWRRLRRRGAAASDALAAALGLAVGGLALSLSVLSNILLLAQMGLVLAILLWDRSSRKGTPPRPDHP